MLLTLKVRKQNKVVFEGEAQSVSSVNTVGRFDVLPNHANFISIIKEKLIIVTSNKEKIQLEFPNGVIKCYNNTISIFLGID